MIEITGSAEWRAAHPGAMIGLLELSGVENTLPCQQLDQAKRETETRLRAAYAGCTRKDFLALPVMSAYAGYYKRFEKTYHVLLQLESIVLKGKSLPAVSPLVDANFAAEVETLVLTAGHDAGKLVAPVWIDATRSGDQMTQMNGVDKLLPAGDMVMRDQHGVCCTILYGQDNLSPITAGTKHVLYVSYVPQGVPAELVEEHLQRMEQYVRLFSPDALLEQRRLLRA